MPTTVPRGTGALSGQVSERELGDRLRSLLTPAPTATATPDPIVERFNQELVSRLDQPVDRRTQLDVLQEAGVTVLPASIGRRLLPDIIREQAAKPKDGKLPFKDFMDVVERFRLLRAGEINLEAVRAGKQTDLRRSRISEINALARLFEGLQDERSGGKGKSTKPEDALRLQLESMGATVPQLKERIQAEELSGGPPKPDNLLSPLDRLAREMLKLDPAVREQKLLGAESGLDTGARSAVRKTRTQTQRRSELQALEKRIRNAKSQDQVFREIATAGLNLSQVEFASLLVAGGFGKKEAIEMATQLGGREQTETTPPETEGSDLDFLRDSVERGR